MQQQGLRFIIGFVILLSVAGPRTTWSRDREGDLVRYQIQVFRLAGGFQSKTSLADDIWRGSKDAWHKLRREVRLFDKGEFQLGDDKLEINHRGCFWNGMKLTFEEGYKAKLPPEKIKMIYSPNILKKTHELARMKIESKQPFQYLQRREDGLFELKEARLPVGMDIEIKAEDKGDDVFLISYLEIDLRTVGRRERVPGVNLAIGYPILREWEYKMKLFVEEGRNYGILLRPKGTSGAIVIRMEVEDR